MHGVKGFAGVGWKDFRVQLLNSWVYYSRAKGREDQKTISGLKPSLPDSTLRIHKAKFKNEEDHSKYTWAREIQKTIC